MSSPRYIKSLRIRRKDGSETVVDSSFIELRGGLNLDIEKTADNTFTVSAGAGRGSQNPGMKQKYDALMGGGSGEYDGVPYTFSGAPYYYSRLNGASPEDGHAFLTAVRCGHWGLFENIPYPYSYSGSPEDGVLQVTDVCAPCVDCADYQVLYLFLDAIKDALDYKKDLIVQHAAQSPGDTEQKNILELYKQAMLYWNNMVQQTSWRCNAQADGGEVDAACRFTNHFDRDIPAGFHIEVLFLDNVVSEEAAPMGMVLDHKAPSGWVEGSDYELYTDPPDYVTYVNSAWTSNTGAKTLTIEGSGPAVGDFIRARSTSPTVTDKEVLEVTDVPDGSHFTVYVPDLYSSTPASGSVEWGVVPRVGMRILRALPVGESIKLYAGMFMRGYSGSGGRIRVRFENNLKNWFSDFPDAKEEVTNKMVLVTEGT